MVEEKNNQKSISLGEVILSKLQHNKFLVAGMVLLLGILFVVSNSPTENLDERSIVQVNDQYLIGTVLEILEEKSDEINGQVYAYQIVAVQLQAEEGSKVVEIRSEIQPGSEESQRLEVGEQIVVTSPQGANEEELFYVSDKYRLPAVIIIFGIFFGLTVVFAGMKGLTSIIGLMFTIFVLINYVVPQIVAGEDPLKVSLIGALVIAVVSLYLAHGFSKRISVALVGTLITIFIAAILAVLFVSMARLFGTGSEEALLLNVNTLGEINLKGLLLGGIIFGALGVLDDVTTAQAAAVEELKRANPKLDFKELYQRGISIGKEHIVSLVNTLVLAYIGSSFPILLLFSLNQGVPLWLTLNSEFIMEEVIRTLVGSSALIFAVPITTLLAAYYFSKYGVGEDDIGQVHVHKH